MFNKHLSTKRLRLCSLALIVFPLLAFAADPHVQSSNVEYAYLPNHDHKDQLAKCEQIKNFIAGMTRKELKEHKISNECIHYAYSGHESHKVTFGKPVRQIKIRQHIQPESQGENKIPLYAPNKMQLVRYPGVYRLTVATGVNRGMQHHDSKNKLSWGDAPASPANDNITSSQKSSYGTYPLRQFMLAVSRDVGAFHHNMIELEYLFSKLDLDKVSLSSGSSGETSINNPGSSYDITLHAFLLNLYFNSAPRNKLEYVFGLGFGPVYRDYDLTFNNTTTGSMAGKTGKLNWGMQPIIGLRYRLNPMLQLMLDYRLLIMGQDKIKLRGVGDLSPATSMFYKTDFMVHTLNLGLVYQLNKATDDLMSFYSR